MKKTIVTIAAIRPDIPRLAATIKLLDRSEYNHVFVATGQHYDYNLFDQFLVEFDLRQPDIRLSSGAPGRQAWEQISICGQQLVDALNKLNPRPSLVLFLGDSNSVASSIAVRRAGYVVAHAESFMRAFSSMQDMYAQGGCYLPEELNRKLITQASSIFFTYHDDYMEHARREGVPLDSVFNIGNTIVEAVRAMADTTDGHKKNKIAMDIHREGNITSRFRLEFILNAARKYSREFGLPVKMLDFKRTIDAISNFELSLDGIELVPLMGYRDYLKFQRESLFVFGCSGTNVEECPLLGVPVVCVREETERPQGFTKENNCGFLLKANWDSFAASVEWLKKWRIEDVRTEWLGKGNSSGLILKYLKETDGRLW